MAQVRIEDEATNRLDQLGLSVEKVHRALLRADAEARQSNDLDPPNLGGFNRWGKGVRFLREELLPDGWTYDNSRLFCRTIHPSGDFAIVVSSGDCFAGEFLSGVSPSTKYGKGETVVRAIATNEQLMLDFEIADAHPTVDSGAMITWFLLFRATSDAIFAEVSLPSAISEGTISDWNERIIIPPIDRETLDFASEDRSDDEDGYDVNVSMR